MDLLSASRWVTRPSPRPGAGLRLFCLPFGGGGALAYRQWAGRLPPGIEVCPIQLPGREDRRDEPGLTELPVLLDALAAALRPSLDRPFALYGHSMGAILSFELTRLLRRRGEPLPVQLFLGACPALHGRRELVYGLSELPELELLQAISARYGTPVTLLSALDPERRQLGLATLRADLRLVEGYRYAPESPLPVPISAFSGDRDPSTRPDEVAGWSEHTTASFRLRVLPGGHFFFMPEQDAVLQAIAEDLGLAPAPRA